MHYLSLRADTETTSFSYTMFPKDDRRSLTVGGRTVPRGGAGGGREAGILGVAAVGLRLNG